MTQTRVLPVKKDSIVFDAGASLPRISDKETEKNLRIVADELINTDNAVAFPTETVYGLGGSALRDESVKAIYRAKNRPADNPLIVHVSSIEQLERILLQDYKIPHQYRQLIEKFWPGPLTILLPVLKGSGISKYVTAEQDTFAVRIPGNIIARSLIAISDTPLAAPSANASTRPSPTTADHVYSDLQGKIPYILDGGSSSVGVESTVVDGLSDPPKILRPGGISAEQIRQVGGPQWRDVQVMTKSNASEPVRTPGMKYKHYSPTAKVILFIDCGNGIEAINKYIRDTNSSQKRIALLKTRQFVRESDVHRNIVVEKELGVLGADISRNLFLALREVDTKEVDLIFVEGVAEDNEGLAIMNRLTKAASDVINSS